MLGANQKPITIERGYYSVDYDCAPLYDFLQQPIEAYSAIIEENPNMFLRGFFDAEGYASPVLNHAKRTFQGILLGAVNTKLEYLDVVKVNLSSYQINPRLVRTHKAGDMMTIRGRSFVRKHDVYHLVISRQADVELFHDQIGFSIPDKREKLTDMVSVRRQLNSQEAYTWFTSHYLYHNHRWSRKRM